MCVCVFVSMSVHVGVCVGVGMCRCMSVSVSVRKCMCVGSLQQSIVRKSIIVMEHNTLYSATSIKGYYIGIIAVLIVLHVTCSSAAFVIL